MVARPSPSNVILSAAEKSNCPRLILSLKKDEGRNPLSAYIAPQPTAQSCKTLFPRRRESIPSRRNAVARPLPPSTHHSKCYPKLYTTQPRRHPPCQNSSNSRKPSPKPEPSEASSPTPSVKNPPHAHRRNRRNRRRTETPLVQKLRRLQPSPTPGRNRRRLRPPLSPRHPLQHRPRNRRHPKILPKRLPPPLETEPPLTPCMLPQNPVKLAYPNPLRPPIPNKEQEPVARIWMVETRRK